MNRRTKLWHWAYSTSYTLANIKDVQSRILPKTHSYPRYNTHKHRNDIHASQ